jgi:hypothetical protein
MKKLYVVVAVLAVSVLGCQDTREETGSTPEIAYQKSIGMQIPVETGLRWMDTYNEVRVKDGRVSTSSYSISASQLQALRSSVLIFVGLAFHHAIDDAGEHHFVVVPVDLTLSLWSSLFPHVYIDANTNTQISRSTALAWVDNYTEAHPNDIWFHFFGSDIFDEIEDIPFFTTMQIEPAINDLDLTPQLLLIIEDEGAVEPGGRTAQSTMVVYDASSACPPCQVHE